MKKIILLLVLIMLSGCSSVKVSESDLHENTKDSAALAECGSVIVDMSNAAHIVKDGKVIEYTAGDLYRHSSAEVDDIEKMMLDIAGGVTLAKYAEDNGVSYLRVACDPEDWPSALKMGTLISYFKDPAKRGSLTVIGTDMNREALECLLNLLDNPSATVNSDDENVLALADYIAENVQNDYHTSLNDWLLTH